LIVSAAALALFAYLGSRIRPVSDTVAARLDRDAGLDGELRSASWFAESDRRDPWTIFHLERAAERVRLIDWTQLYPAVRAPRSRMATALMVVGVFILSARWPGRAIDAAHRDPTSAVAVADAETDEMPASMLPADLQKK